MQITLENLPKIMGLVRNLPPDQQHEMLKLLDEWERAKSRELSQEKFIPFVNRMWPGFISGRHHKIMGEKFEEIASGKLKRLIICMPPRHCLTLDTPILTTQGWKTMETVQPGDYVFGPDGLPTLVVGKSEVHQDRDLYRVTTNDGASVITDAGHRWMVRLDRKRNLFHEYTTEQLWARDQGAFVRTKANGEVEVNWDRKVPIPRAAMLPPITAGELLDSTLPIDPDMLKVWLKNRFIRVEKLNQTGAVQCIEVAREDHLFLAGKGMICTLNTKSEFGSFLFPAWFLGKYPNKKVIQSSHTAELAVGFGRKVRNLVDSEDYKSVFPDTHLRADSKAAGRWSTSKGGEYFAIGIGGAVTGKGADLLIIDDPHDEQEGQSSDPAVFDHAYEWYTSGPRQRLQPGGAIVIICTRWSKRDLVGQVLKASAQRGGDEWEVIEFPAIMPSGKPLWPEFWPLAELEAIREEIPTHKWQAQYQQNPTSEEGALIKREWWKVWERDKPPEVQFLIQSWDTAFLKSQRADYSACTTWGVFYHPDGSGLMQPNLILMDAMKEKMEFPTLKKRAYELYQYWKPESLIVEAKAAGTPLIFELRAMGIPVSEYTPTRGNDKIARVNAVADLFSSGKVWRPNTRFAEEVVEEFASFPAGEHDDYVDSCTQALLRYRRGGFVNVQSDYQDEPVYKRKTAYY